jgi:LmbE family N-acetylglucosaminyl deacetylase
MNVLVIGAHPDDEVLGVGGTMARHVMAGDKVTALILTEAKGYPDMAERRRETARVHKQLGVNSIHLHFPTTRLDTLPLRDIAQSIGDVIKKVKPEILYTHFRGDVNQDHRAIFHATLVAVRFDRRIKRLYCYEALSSTELGPDSFDPNHFVDITKTLNKKIQAMKGYPRELKKFPHPRSLEGIRIAAEARGLLMGSNAAEAFRLIRSFDF